MIGGRQQSLKPPRRFPWGRVASLLMVALGTALVVGSGFGVYLVLENAPRIRPVEMKEVVVVGQEVGERLPVPMEALRLVRAPADLVPASAVVSLADAQGKVAAARLMPGEMLLSHRLMDRIAGNGLALALQAGEVAVTFPATGVGSVGGLLPGDRVDVLVTLPSKPTQAGLPSGPPYTTMALQNLRLLSVAGGGSASQGGAIAKVGGTLGATSSAGSSSGQVVIAATYEDALFLKALKDTVDVKLDLVLRPVEKGELPPGDGVTLLDGLRLRHILEPEGAR